MSYALPRMMSEAGKEILILGDLHLDHSPERSLPALEKALRRHPSQELILNGDILDLSQEPPARAGTESISRHLRRHQGFGRILRGYLEQGGNVTWIAGNHDAVMGHPDARGAVLSELGLGPGAAFSVAPWCVRRGGVHVEHGHIYDPDNAPAHPLGLWEPKTEPLGTALTRQFVAGGGAWIYAHAHKTTPVAGLLRAFKQYGAKAPEKIALYFAVAGRLCVRARTQSGEFQRQRAEGELLVDAYAARTGLSPEVLRALVAALPAPTHERFSSVFTRLYFDRVLATLLLACGVGKALTGSVSGAAAAGVSAAYLAASVSRSKDRVGVLPEQRSRDAAQTVRNLTGARLVVFGHTHLVDRVSGYENPGSFAFSETPTYVWATPDGERSSLLEAGPAVSAPAEGFQPALSGVH